MATIHEEIDNWVAAEIHGELPEHERGALHAHLVECAACRKAYQENKIMNKILEETLATEKADPTFEQRMLSGFRSRTPQRSRLVKLVADLMRLRAVQITVVAAVLLGLVQIGRMITGEGSARAPEWGYLPGARLPAQQANAPLPTSGVESAEGALDKTSQLASGRSDLVPRGKSSVAPAAPTAHVEEQRQEALALAVQEPSKEAA
ncbi:MAG TPA: zf-HC2 domain-containing protein, partial [Candidatus Udaeobacter sp.]|nr:zf-HC2 domain-containing protein [Candidatus Udaeobacter sp.]